MNEPLWQDYHKHTSLSNVYTKDSPLIHLDYWNELKARYGDKPCAYTTVEHGYPGNYMKTYSQLEKFNKKNGTNIKFVFGYEAYWVKDRHTDDKSNCHMILLARNDNGRKALNKILSIANKDGYYYRPRLDLELIMSLPPDDVMLTSACVAYWNKYQDIDDITAQLASKFPYFYLEVQPHHTQTQADLNRHILELSSRLNVPIIAGCDSHVIFESQMKDRDDLLESAHITYEDEDGWFMDFPTYDVLFNRFQQQGVLSDEQIKQAIDSTNVLMDFEDIILDRSLKVPVVKSLRDKTQQERNDEFERIVWSEWEQQKWDINEAKHDEYIKEINDAINEIEACNMADYFITTYYTMKDGQEKYGGILTPSGRGSAVSMYLNKILRFTKVDKVNSSVEMYPERFLTKERVLESHTPPDIDHNVSDRQPFIKAQRELVGELGTYDLLALGTLKTKAAWKMYARAHGIDPQVANKVSGQINSYEQSKKHAENPDDVNIEDFITPEFKELFEGCRRYLGIYDSRKGHPCFLEDELVNTPNGYCKIKDISIGDCVVSGNGELKNVINTMKSVSDDIYNITIYGAPSIKVTGNHPFYVSRRKYLKDTTAKGEKRKELLAPKWKQVNELEKNDLIGTPVNNKEILPKLDFVQSHNCDFWWTIGRYFGDGWRSHTVRKSGRQKGYQIKNVIICCNKNNNEIEDIKKHLTWCNFRVSTKKNSSIYEIYLKCNGLYEWLNQFGDYAENKHINHNIIDLPILQLSHFLNGYLSADGYINENGRARFTTISKSLLLGIISCIHKCYKTPCSVSQREFKNNLFQNRIVNRHISYEGSFKLNSKSHAFYKDGYIWCPYKKKEKINDTSVVYNLEVEDNHSYTINNFSVHNCATICYQGDVESDIGVILCKSDATGNEVLTALIESDTIDEFGYLKQDYLIVDSIGLTYDIYKEIGIEPYTVNQLLDKIKTDDATWNIYRDGFTQCVNQCEQAKSTQKVMRYKPKNISELTQFIAGIRPGFQSMYHLFESRQHFEYGIKALDDLIQDEYRTSSFIIYQEDLMKVLEFAGFPMAETYTIIKAISKKKDYVIKEAKPKFISGFAKAIMNTSETDDESKANELAEKVWHIVEDNSAYGFNCVSGDTIISGHTKTIAELYNIIHTQGKKLYSYSMTEDYRFRANRIVDIYKQQEAPVYLVETYTGENIKCTGNHKFPTSNGIKTALELTDDDFLFIKVGKDIPIKSRFKSIEPAGVETVYDIEMSGDVAHNFVLSNGLVTCNSAHAYCMAIDSVTIAYLKAHYPLEFYKCVLQRFSNKGEKDKVSLIKQEAIKRGIAIKEIKFGDDNREFNIDHDNNAIVQNMSGIKNMPKATPQALYELGQSGINTRTQLYQALMDDLRINSKAIDILFKLDYFSAFAHPNRLLTEFEIYNKYIDAKVISKKNLTNEQMDVLRNIGAKETATQFRNFDNMELIKAMIKTKSIPKTSIYQRIKWQIEFLGYSTLNDPSIDPSYWMVVDVESGPYERKDATLYNICYGVTRKYRLNKKFNAKHEMQPLTLIQAVVHEKPKMKKNEDGSFSVVPNEFVKEVKCWKEFEIK